MGERRRKTRRVWGRPIRLLVVMAMTAAVFTGVTAGPAAAAVTTDIVTPGFFGPYFLGLESGGPPAGVGLVTGPATPPLGAGSAEFKINGAPDGAVAGAGRLIGADLAGFTDMEYSTYRSAPASGPLAVALQLQVDFDSTDASLAWQGRLVFEPYHTGEAVLSDVWQTWNPMSYATGGFWQTGTPVVGDAAQAQACPQSAPCTWSEVLSAYPNAEVHTTFGGLVFKVGSGVSTPFVGNVDGATFDYNGGADSYVVDFEPTPSASIAATASIAEGDAGTTDVLVPVTLSNPTGVSVTVNYTTADGSAEEPGDYSSTTDSVTFLPYETVKYASVPIVGDLDDENDEDFTISLTGASNATVGSPSTSTVTINDDDTTVASLGAGDIEVVEGNSGTQSVMVTVTLSVPSVNTVSVNYATQNNTATTTGDYLPASGTLTFDPGDTSESFNVTVKGDTKLEDYEFFKVNLSSPVNATIGVSSQTVTILNDEKPNLTYAKQAAKEGKNVVFKPKLSHRYYLPIAASYSTTNGSAVAPGDYGQTVGVLNFGAGTKGPLTVVVPTYTDFLVEGDETFSLSVSSASIKSSPVVRNGKISANTT